MNPMRKSRRVSSSYTSVSSTDDANNNSSDLPQQQHHDVDDDDDDDHDDQNVRTSAPPLPRRSRLRPSRLLPTATTSQRHTYSSLELVREPASPSSSDRSSSSSSRNTNSTTTTNVNVTTSPSDLPTRSKGRAAKSTGTVTANNNGNANNNNNNNVQHGDPLQSNNNNNASPSANNSSKETGEKQLRGDNGDDDTADKDAQLISIVVLDPAQAKFPVRASPDWTVASFKQAGQSVHQVPSASQRLIFRGKLLTDDKTLKDFGIVDDGAIVHLFPKPKVVVASNDNNNNNNNNNTSSSSSSDRPAGAHVPHIVLNPQEAEQRSSILVLGSDEILEAQNNVKLFSFMLLIICSMELLALFTLMLGGPQDPSSSSSSPNSPALPPYSGGDDMLDPASHNTSINGNSMDDMPMRTWQNTDYIDLVISSVGFYVATLGIKATNENTVALARQYLWGTFAVGIAWNLYYFFLNLQVERQTMAMPRDDDVLAKHYDSMNAGDLVSQALLAIMLPSFVWLMCCLRAYQFHHLIQEAEQEATLRIRAELDVEVGNTTTTTNNDNDSNNNSGRDTNPGMTTTTTTATTNNNSTTPVVFV